MDFSAKPLDEKELLRRLLEGEEAPKKEEDSEDAPETAEEGEKKTFPEAKAIEQRVLEQAEALRREREKNKSLENQVDVYAESFKAPVQEQKEYAAGGSFGGEYGAANSAQDPNLYTWQQEQHRLKEPDDAEARKRRAIL